MRVRPVDAQRFVCSVTPISRMGPFSLINPDAYTDQAHPVDKNGQDCLLDRGLGSDAVRQIRTESAPDLSSSGVRV